MARLDSLPESIRGHLATLPCPTFETTPFVESPDAGERRVAMISTAGLHLRGDRPFSLGSDDYRVIPGEVKANDLVMSHLSAIHYCSESGRRPSPDCFPYSAKWFPGCTHV